MAKWVPAVLAIIVWTSLWLSLGSACHSSRVIPGCALFSFPSSSFFMSSHFVFYPKCAQVPQLQFVLSLLLFSLFIIPISLFIVLAFTFLTNFSPAPHSFTNVLPLLHYFSFHSGCTCTPYIKKSWHTGTHLCLLENVPLLSSSLPPRHALEWGCASCSPNFFLSLEHFPSPGVTRNGDYQQNFPGTPSFFCFFAKMFTPPPGYPLFLKRSESIFFLHEENKTAAIHLEELNKLRYLIFLLLWLHSIQCLSHFRKQNVNLSNCHFLQIIVNYYWDSVIPIFYNNSTFLNEQSHPNSAHSWRDETCHWTFLAENTVQSQRKEHIEVKGRWNVPYRLLLASTWLLYCFTL